MKSYRKEKPLSPDLRVVLDWLCRQPARVFDFTEVADGVSIKRGAVERILSRLRHIDFGGHLKGVGPDGHPLRNRFAYLPADATVRESYPPIDHPKVKSSDHPALVAVERNRKEHEENEAARIAAILSRQAERAVVFKTRKAARKKALASMRGEEVTQPKKEMKNERRNDRGSNGNNGTTTAPKRESVASSPVPTTEPRNPA